MESLGKRFRWGRGCYGWQLNGWNALCCLTLNEKRKQHHHQRKWVSPHSGNTVRECTPAELTDKAAKFQQKARGNIPTWLVWLWIQGDGGPLNGQESGENEQRDHTPPLPHSSACIAPRGSGYSLLTGWIILCRETWPIEGVLLGHLDLGSR